MAIKFSILRRFKKILLKMNNFYILFGLAFVIWMSFFDSNDIYSQYLLRKKFTKLEHDRVYYRESMVKLKQEMKELSGGTRFLEKFVREKYQMKKKNEDVYVLVKE